MAGNSYAGLKARHLSCQFLCKFDVDFITKLPKNLLKKYFDLIISGDQSNEKLVTILNHINNLPVSDIKLYSSIGADYYDYGTFAEEEYDESVLSAGYPVGGVKVLFYHKELGTTCIGILCYLYSDNWCGENDIKLIQNYGIQNATPYKVIWPNP